MAEEKVVLGAESAFPLDGIVTLPDDSVGLVPAAILVHGSGPSNMDEKIGNTAPFKDLAEGLAKKGIAVLRYDKRTYVYGKEMVDNTGLTVKEEVIEDAVLAADFLRKDARIDTNKIFIIGHSLGGMLAPRIDAEGGNFAGIIIMAGSPRKLEEIIIDQNSEVLNSLNKLAKMLAKKQINKLISKFSNLYSLSDEQAKSTLVFGQSTRAYYFKEMGERPSSNYLNELEKPLFILQGEKDFQVSVENDFNSYKNLLRDRANVSFKLYSQLNHLFMPSVHGEILKMKQEYNLAQHVDQQVIDDIGDWIYSI